MTLPFALTPDWLSQRLRQNNHLTQGKVVSLTLAPTIDTTAAFVTPLTVTYSANAPQSAPQALIFKLFRPAWYGGGVVEARLYSDIATAIDNPAIPRCYDAHFDPQNKQGYLLLEDISLTHAPLPWPIPDHLVTPEELQPAVDAILPFHCHWWQHPQLETPFFMRPHGGPLRLAQAIGPDDIRQHAAALANAFPAVAAKMGADLPPAWRHLCQTAITAWPDLLINRIASGKGLTLIHGDYHLGNLYRPFSTAAHPWLILDWETYKRGLGPYDLAYQWVLGLTADQRRRIERPLLQHYHHSLLAAGITNYTWDDCLADYRLSIIACLFPPLLWERATPLANVMTAFDEWHCPQLLNPN